MTIKNLQLFFDIISVKVLIKFQQYEPSVYEKLVFKRNKNYVEKKNGGCKFATDIQLRLGAQRWPIPIILCSKALYYLIESKRKWRLYKQIIFSHLRKLELPDIFESLKKCLHSCLSQLNNLGPRPRIVNGLSEEFSIKYRLKITLLFATQTLIKCLD